jgi:ABC-type Fe3+/spermidine/putrescine transport system ATPase subunit
MAALDRKLRQEVQVELRELQRSLGITTVLVTHDQEEALSLSDRIVVLDDGRVQQVATPDEAYLHPSNRFVADFLGTANFFEGTLRRNGITCKIELDNGDAVECAESDLPEGSQACAMLRPERLRLTAGDTEHGLHARVRGAIYLGQLIRYHLELHSGQKVIATSADRVIKHGPGSEIKLTWDPSDVWIIPAEDAGGG